MINQNKMNEMSEILQISELVTNNNMAEANLAESNLAETNFTQGNLAESNFAETNFGKTDFAFLAGRERGIKAGPECPECRMRMIRLGVCFSCPECGYGSCG